MRSSQFMASPKSRWCEKFTRKLLITSDPSLFQVPEQPKWIEEQKDGFKEELVQTFNLFLWTVGIAHSKWLMSKRCSGRIERQMVAEASLASDVDARLRFSSGLVHATTKLLAFSSR